MYTIDIRVIENNLPVDFRKITTVSEIGLKYICDIERVFGGGHIKKRCMFTTLILKKRHTTVKHV